MASTLNFYAQDAITGFRQRNGGNVPERIIIYRDGVSEGEYARVMSNEIQQVEGLRHYRVQEYLSRSQ
jgi:hypothetical protein